MGMDTSPFFHITVNMALEALARSKEHVPRPKPPVPIDTLRAVIMTLQQNSTQRSIATAVLLMFYAGLRQSEVAPRSITTYDKTRNTSRCDVRVVEGKVHFHQKWAKNQQLNAQNRDITLLPAQSGILCPVAAVTRMLIDVPTTHPEQPLLVFKADGNPICIPYITRIWNQALKTVGAPEHTFSLHSIRKAAATTAYQSGVPELEIQRFGGWSSHAYKIYISTKASNKVNKALISALKF